MTQATITPVILAGGKGTRLWPLSRTDLPKQFCNLGEELSLFQQTLSRLCGSEEFTAPVILTGSAHLALVRQQLEEIGVEPMTIICEPCGRDTAPAVALAARLGKHLNLQQILVLPSDHKIRDGDAFQDAVRTAATISSEYFRIVTFGIKPTAPATEYGYLEAGDPLADGLGSNLSSFIEKPDETRANTLFKKDNVFWNAGVFLFSPAVMCHELDVYAPDLSSKVKQSLYACDLDAQLVSPDEQSFSSIVPISLDYAVMEKTDRAAIVPVDPQWSDVGSWDAVWQASEKDQSGNHIAGNAVCTESRDSYITSDGPVIAVAALDNVVVVANRDAVLVTSRDSCQSVKPLLAQLGKRREHEHLTRSHAHERRPWGEFTSLHKGEMHQVKTISVKPGGQLSLQYHFHRAEHWIVVKGVATVTIDDERMTLGPTHQVFIPQGAVHRLENEGVEDVEIIEVQYGSYLGEDDIVRVEDVYGRPEAGNSEIASRLLGGS